MNRFAYSRRIYRCRRQNIDAYSADANRRVSSLTVRRREGGSESIVRQNRVAQKVIPQNNTAKCDRQRRSKLSEITDSVTQNTGVSRLFF